MRRTFTFSGILPLPILALFFAFTTVLIISWINEQNFFLLFLIALNLVMGITLLLASYFRRLTIGLDEVKLRRLSGIFTLQLKDVRHFGVVKYRSFRFLYLSTSETRPFTDPDQPVVSSPETFVIQYRARAWDWLIRCLREVNPELEPDSRPE